MPSWFYNLRVRLMLLVVLASLPALAAIVYNGVHERNLGESRAEEQALTSARLMSSEFQTLVNSGHQFLETLSQLPEVSSSDAQASSVLFASFFYQNPQYANIGAVAPDGTVFASAVPMQTPFNFSAVGWFQTAMATHEFTIGDYMVGPIIAPRYTIHLAHPFVGASGQVKGVLFVALDLGWLDQRISAPGLPEGSTLVLVDSNGVVLVRYPDPAGYVGQSIINEPLGKAMVSAREGGSAKVAGLDGSIRLYGFVPLTQTGKGPYLAIGVPESVAFADVNSQLRRNILALIITIVLGALLAFFATGALVMRPVRGLVAATRRLANGDLEARSGMTQREGELGQLAGAFDDMAEALKRQGQEAEHSIYLLRESESRYRGLYDSIRDGILMTDLDGRILECNQTFLEMVGYTREAITRLTNEEITPVKWRKTDGGMLRHQVMVKGYSDEYEKEYRARDGKIIPTAAKVWLVKDDTGKPKALWGIMRDITERKRTQSEIETSRRFLEIANRHGRIGPLLNDFVVEIKALTGCSAIAIRLLGYSGDIPYAVSIGFSRAFCESESALSVHSDRCWCISVIAGNTDSSMPWYTGFGSFFINGTTRFLSTASPQLKAETRNVCNAYGFESLALVPIRSGDRILGLIQVADERDGMVPLDMVKQLEKISATMGVCVQRARAEESLEETQAYLNNLLDYANAPIIVWDAAFTVTRFNHAFERLTGMRAEHVIGKRLDVLFPEGTRDLSMAYVGRTQTGERFETVEIPIARTDGSTRTVLWNSATLFATDGDTLVATIAQGQDITERKAAEEDVKRLNAELTRNVSYLEAANKELEAFSYSVSHDLRAPLRAMSGFSQVMLDDYSDKVDEEGKRYLGIIASNAQKMGQLINDLLAFSRLSRAPLNIAKIDMEDLARQVFAEQAAGVPDKAFGFSVEKLPPAYGDASMVRQMLVNLIANAIKFTRPKTGAAIQIGFRSEGGENVYYVRDNGVGFDMQYRNKLFGVFQRLHREVDFEGTGVGLAIVQRIVLRHGGRVWTESVVGEGATFYFTLPGNQLKLE